MEGDESEGRGESESGEVAELVVPGDELDCPVCMRLIYDPVGVPSCGHTLCRVCLHRSLEQRRLCPLCRAPCDIDALSHPANALLARLLEKYAGAAYAARAREAAVERRRRRPRLGVFEVDRPVAPGTTHQLVIFEMRYRIMLSRAMATNRRFLMTDPAAPGYGLVVRVDRSAQHPDGRSQITVVGDARARVSAPEPVDNGSGLQSMEAEEIVDEPLPANEAARAAVAHLVGEVERRVRAMDGSARAVSLHGEPPADDPAELSLWVVRACGGRAALVTDLLLSPSPAERLRLAINLLDEREAASARRSLGNYPGVLTALVLFLMWYFEVFQLVRDRSREMPSPTMYMH